MSASASFTPSGTPVTYNLQSGISQSIALPAVDASNLDLSIANSGSGPVLLAFGGTVPVTFDSPTVVRVPGQSQVLLTANTTVLSLLASNPLVLNSVYAQSQAVAAQTATSAMVITAGGSPITISRGTASATSTFRTAL